MNPSRLLPLLHPSPVQFTSQASKRERKKKKKMAQITEEMKAKAEIWYGDEIGQEKCKFVLKEANLPNGLIPLKDIIECGYIEETGFVWLKQKKKIEHKFEKIGKMVQYAAEITAYVEKNRMRKLTGVKAKEMLVWISLDEFYVDDPPTGKITFKIPAGLSRSYPVSAFMIDEKEGEEEKKKMNKDDNKVDVKQIKDEKKVEVKKIKEVEEEVMNKMKEAKVV